MIINAEELERLITHIFTAQGAPQSDASIVARHLVGANLCGTDTHGVIRTMTYTQDIENGALKLGAQVTVVKESPTTAVVDFGGNFGQVGAMKMVEVVTEKARKRGMACAVSRRAYHVGRLGAYTEELARRGLLALAMTSVSEIFSFVAPWGGREGRLSTNPISYAAPTLGEPVLMDIATTAVAQGKALSAWQRGVQMPPDILADNEGRPTTDPRWGLTGLKGSEDRFKGGTFLPMGGQVAGHKGYALGTFVEAYCSVLAGQDRTPAEKHPDYMNVFYLQAVNPEFFYGQQDYRERMQQLSAYIKSSKPAAGFKEVLMPGELEVRARTQRMKDGINLPEKTWEDLSQIACRYGVSFEHSGDVKRAK